MKTMRMNDGGRQGGNSRVAEGLTNGLAARNEDDDDEDNGAG